MREMTIQIGNAVYFVQAHSDEPLPKELTFRLLEEDLTDADSQP